MPDSSISKSDVDVLVRLASTSFPFRVPVINAAGVTSFERSFKSVGSHPSTLELMRKADHAREALATSLMAGTRTKIVTAADIYIPLVYSVMVTCIAQPDEARLDDRLIFQWASSLEAESKRKKKVFYQSEAMMYDMVMAIASQAFAKAAIASEDAKAGDFTSASQNFKAAAGIMKFLANEQLPKWAGQGNNVFDANLPCETSMEVCDALEMLFLAMAQQMAVVTVLRKPEENFGLLAKLTLGVAEKLEAFMSAIREKAASQMQRMDPAIFAYVESQAKVQRSLSGYFQARSMWDKILLGELLTGYGVVIVMQREAIALLGSIPKSPSKSQHSDVTALLKHMKAILKSWEKDNNTIYFEQPPKSVPDDKKLQQGTFMAKSNPYHFNENAAPVPLMLPARKMPLNSLMRGIGIRN